MKNNNLKLAVTLSLLALAGFATSASADIITINFDDPLPGDFVWDDIDTNNGNCAPSGAPCMHLNAGPGQTKGPYTLSRSGGGMFSLDSYWFQLLGVPAILDVSGEQYSVGDWSHNVGYVVDSDLVNVTSITFSNIGTGNIRVDDLVVSFIGGDGDGDGDGDPVQVPEPGTLGLLGLGLLGFGFKGRRKV